jgi:hypothetical protein
MRVDTASLVRIAGCGPTTGSARWRQSGSRAWTTNRLPSASPAWTCGGTANLDGIDSTIGSDARLLAPVALGRPGDFQMPSTWVDGEVLAIGFERHGTVDFFAGFPTVQAFEASRFAPVHGWMPFEFTSLE